MCAKQEDDMVMMIVVTMMFMMFALLEEFSSALWLQECLLRQILTSWQKNIPFLNLGAYNMHQPTMMFFQEVLHLTFHLFGLLVQALGRKWGRFTERAEMECHLHQRLRMIRIPTAAARKIVLRSQLSQLRFTYFSLLEILFRGKLFLICIQLKQLFANVS